MNKKIWTRIREFKIELILSLIIIDSCNVENDTGEKELLTCKYRDDEHLRSKVLTMKDSKKISKLGKLIQENFKKE